MNEYISKQKVIDYLNGYLHSLGEGDADTLLFNRGQRRALINSIQDISAVKAADVQPVKHGRWENTNTPNQLRCSNCEIIHFIVQYPHGEINYCPNCGIRMDGKDYEEK